MRYLQITSPEEAVLCLKEIGVDPYGIAAMVPKMSGVNIRLDDLKPAVANIIKQEMLSLGGDAAVSRGTIDCTVRRTGAVLMGTEKQVTRLIEKLSRQPLGLRELASAMEGLLSNLRRTAFVLKTPRRRITITGRTLIMGVINVTPDSFSDGGRFRNVDAAVDWGVRLEEEGADILDVGGESTRPGSGRVSRKEEIKRVIPVLEKLVRRIRIPVSVDTMKSEVARAAMDSGAEIINDVSAMRFDRAMLDAMAESGAPVILMHMRGMPRTMQEGDLRYGSLMGDIIRFLGERIGKAVKGGVARENIIVDPGIGFGKKAKDNIRIIRHLRELKTLGRPVALGPSRKAFIGKTTGVEIPAERIEGTAAAVTAAILNGANILRVHDVGFMKRVAAMAEDLSRD
ncbi:MAG TPA: dihydropteroate synthase [Syntrophales bacterium]|nr:dihydropteroate synthase [Syntrophales bacterium]HPN23551.1 dihydropteroate synthase [Syntrophales bacterium]